jgi:geranylgeranyl diphosphate synthase type II
LTHAFTLIADNAKIPSVSAKAVVEAVRVISHHAGTFGMVGGQVADIQSDGGRWKKKRSREFPTVTSLLDFIHMKKTAALIVGSLHAGAVLSGANRRQISALIAYGEAISLAFQVQDDILDRVGDKKKLGKKGSDAANKKLTYVAVYGIEASRLAARALIEKAHRALKPFGRKAAPLHALADFIVSRDH